MMEFDRDTHYICPVCKSVVDIKELQQHCLKCAKEFGVKCKNCNRRVANENYVQHVNACLKLYNNNSGNCGNNSVNSSNNSNNKHKDNNPLSATTSKDKASNVLTYNGNLLIEYNFTDIDPDNKWFTHSEKKTSKNTILKPGSIHEFEVIDTIDDFTNSIQLIP